MAKLSAHRGGPEGYLPDNALETIETACALGVDLIEFDVRVAKTGEFRIGHDRAGATTLREVLEVIKGRAQAHVDLKQARAEVEIAALCTEILGPDGFIVTSGVTASVRRLRLARPDLMVGLSIGRGPIHLGPVHFTLLRWSELFPWHRLRRCNANLVVVHYGLARWGVLAGAYRRGLPAMIWTINTEDQLRTAQRDERVWAYTTDYPRLALRLAAEAENDPPFPTG